MRNLATRLVVAAAATALIACGPAAPARETAADTAAIRTLGDNYKAAWNAGDAAAQAQLVTEDYSAIEPDGSTVSGRAAYETMVKTEGEARKGSGMMLDFTPGHIVFLSPTSATSTGTFTLKGAPPGAPDKGSYLVVTVKGADGTWRVRNSLAAAFIAPPPPPKK